MRLTFLIAAAGVTLALGACRDRGQADRNAAGEASLTAENIVSNDVTAIDAVTADAANMAADVDYTDALANLSNNAADAKPKTVAPVKAKPTDSATNAN
ncbi:MAG: hypothetical protein ABIS38_06505 [Sphingomicrobium sp.]